MVVCPKCGRESAADARFCSACGSPLATEPAAAREERKVVSVVFVDLVGHTGRSEVSDPEDVRATLAPYHARARDELERHGGTVEKFIGDAVMAVFGAPIAHEDDAERAVRAALAVRDAMVDDELDVRVAVNTGEALVALDARAAEGEALVAGDVVNTASRIQSAAPTNGVLVGAATFRATDRAIAYDEAPPVVAKGKAEPVPVWLALGPRARFGVDVGQHGGAKLVGRDVELRLLSDAFERARTERSTQLVTLVGAPGMGKSRLVWELFGHTDAEEDLFAWRQGRALAYGGGPFGAVAEALRAHVGVFESDTPADLEAKVTATVDELFDDPRDREWLAERLRPVVGLEAGSSGGREESFAAWQRLIEAIADRRPLILVLEDLHWADDGTLDFVEHLVDWTRDVPLLVLCTTRPELLERRAAWGGGRLNSHTIALSPLSDDDTARLLGDLLGTPAIDAEVRTRLLQQTGGNPLYAEEYARMLNVAAGAELPDSVQGIIAARLDLLDPPEKHLLQDASVLGKVFWRGGVEALGAEAAPDVLQRLVRKEFIRRERSSSMTGDEEFAFRHALVRDVAYSQLPRTTRGEKHQRAAEWIARSASRPDLVAHHYTEALGLAAAVGGEPAALEAPARVALHAAGDRARRLGAYDDATALYRRALALHPGDDERRKLLVAAVATASPSLDPDAAELARFAVEACEAVGDLSGAADGETALALIAWYVGDGEATASHGERAVALAERSGSTSSAARALAERARVFMLAGHSDRAIEVGERAIELAEAAGLDEVAAGALVTVGTARGNRDVPGAIDVLDRAFERAKAINAPVPMFRALNNKTYLIRRTEGLAAAAEVRDQIESEVLERYAMLSLLRWFDSLSAWDNYQEGNWDESLRWGESFFRRSPNPHYLDTTVLIARGMIKLARGEDVEARADLERGLARVRDRVDGDPQQVGPALVYAARFALLQGRRLDAEAFADELATLDASVIRFVFEGSTEIGWLAVDLERELLDLHAPDSVWRAANVAIVEGRLADAIAVLDATGVRAEAAYARLRRAQREPGPWLDEAEAFYRQVGATRFLGEIADLRERRIMPRSA
jgi:class 3 adenylate cyclase/tetratricopeptide (TPR) repeat protein